MVAGVFLFVGMSYMWLLNNLQLICYTVYPIQDITSATSIQ